MYIYMCVCIFMYVGVCVCEYKKDWRAFAWMTMTKCPEIITHRRTNTHKYIYIYIYRERERERERKTDSQTDRLREGDRETDTQIIRDKEKKWYISVYNIDWQVVIGKIVTNTFSR